VPGLSNAIHATELEYLSMHLVIADLTGHNPNIFYELAEIRIFLVLVWITALSCVATVILYKSRFRVAFAIVSSLSLLSLALMAWVYFNVVY
jgi:hypothetical protein